MKIHHKSSAAAGYRRRQRQYFLAAGILFLMAVFLAGFMLTYGKTVYSPLTVWKVLLGEQIQGASFSIRTLRLPRMLGAVLCGLAFGLAGNTFQKLLGNPLASPDIIGISSGASVAAVFGLLVLGLDGSQVSLLAVAFGLLISVLIYCLARSNGFSNGKLILTGIGVQAFLSAVLSWMLLKASEYDVPGALRWLSGSLNGVKMDDIPPLLAAVLLAGLSIALLNRHLTALQLGETYGITLGVSVNKTRLLLICCSLILVAFATSVSGPIASVAFLSGPVASKLSGEGRSNLLTSALVGAVLVLAADLAGQFAFSSRYPAGVITGLLGAPYLLFLLLRMNRKGGPL